MQIYGIRFAIIALVMMTSAGCGFSLQGHYSIPQALEQLHLSSPDQYSELTHLVRDRLRVNGINLREQDPQVATLTLIKDSLERATLSLYPSGNVAEYELIYRVTFSVALPEQTPQTYTVDIRRDYLDDPRTALAKSREMELLLEEMRIQAADRIIQTLSSLKVS